MNAPPGKNAMQPDRKAAALTFDFTKPAGEPALLAPDSIQWRVFRNPIALGVGGIAAVLMEFADARIRSGVWDHSVYKVDPIGRSMRTGMAAMIGVYGPAPAARSLIAGITRMHAKVGGETPSGRSYRALEPELLNWVHATAAYGFLTAYCRFVRPLDEPQRNRFLAEGRPVAELYGVTEPVETEAQFDRMMRRLLPGFEPHPINLEFLDIIQSGKAQPSLPKFIHRAVARASVSILPPEIRTVLDLGPKWDLTWADRLMLKAFGRMADRRRDPQSPAWQAAIRLGLPGAFAWLPDAAQQRILAGRGPAVAA